MLARLAHRFTRAIEGGLLHISPKRCRRAEHPFGDSKKTRRAAALSIGSTVIPGSVAAPASKTAFACPAKSSG
jgi:hypothetical protein